jgi:N-acetylglucosaminyl-diphospho-decaprenol L-rhamnosyltransferase
LNINIIVLNYNGQKLIPRCLPSIIEAKAFTKSKCSVRITVIDNESTDDSVNILRSYGHDINITRMKNRVFCSYNDVIENQTEEIALILNNDIRVDKGFIDPMINTLEANADAFMVSPKCYDFAGTSLEGGRSKGYIKYGWFGAIAKYQGWEKDIDNYHYTFQSGFGAIRRNRFIELGGYDDLYLPGRLEDSDLCFRAWKKGWKCYYQPKSAIYHIGGVSFKKEFGKNGISSIDTKNSALFFWKNIESPIYWFQHIIFFPLRMLYWLLKGDFAAVKGLFQAFGKIKETMLKRRKEKNLQYVLSDEEVFNIFR